MKTEAVPFEGTESSFFAFDTTLVLFFLALDFGKTIFSPGLGSLLSAITVLAVAGLPFLLFEGKRPVFLPWLGARMVVAGLGLLIGALFASAIGVLLPENLRLLPLTLLIAVAFVSFGLQFYGILRVRLAR